ncbi:hypothetical protein Ancab_040223 [Ancistrocladus abbreviatus]
MVSPRVQDVIVIFIIFLLPFLLVGSVSAQDTVPIMNVSCSNSGNYTPNSEYRYNLDNLIGKLSSESSVTGFYNGSFGESPNQVYALYFCPGDTNQQLCHSCVQNATSTIVNKCPNQIGATLWYDSCLIRYSNESFFGKLDSSDEWGMYLMQNITNVSVTSFMQVVNNTLNQISVRAANGDQLGRKFATQEVNVSSSLKLYALGQCTPDLSASDCRLCLTECTDVVVNYTYGKSFSRIFCGTNCYIRYEIYPFFDQTVVEAPTPAPAPALTASPSGEKKKKISNTVITAIAAAAIASLLLIGSCIFFILRRRAKRRYNTLNAQTESVDIELLTADSLQYDWSTLQAATNNFPMVIR